MSALYQCYQALGQRLFFEPALSANGKRSCASCHRPEKAFCDQRALRFTQNLDRNSLSVLNASGQTSFFHDGRANSLAEARVWSLADHRGTRTIPAHVSDVWATGGGDRKVKFWDVATGTLVQDVSGDLHMAEVENLAFSPSGQTLVSVSRDGSLKFWRGPLPDDRVAALADYELEKWARKGEFEKSDEHQKRLAKRFEHLQELQEAARQQMLSAFGNTANWQTFTLGDYNADAETCTLTSSLWPVNFKVTVSPKEAAGFCEGFARRSFGAPELAFQSGIITLKSAPVLVSSNGETHTYSLTR